jgi:hypothetical protein
MPKPIYMGGVKMQDGYDDPMRCVDDEIYENYDMQWNVNENGCPKCSKGRCIADTVERPIWMDMDDDMRWWCVVGSAMEMYEKLINMHDS